MTLVSSGFVALCVGSALILSLFSAGECHFFVSQAAPEISFLPSLIYGLAVWLWWVPLVLAIAYRLQGSKRFSRFSAGAFVAQAVCAIAATCLHLQLLVFCVHMLVHRWPALWDAGYKALPLWSWGRAIPELLLYLFLWATGAAIRERQAAQSREMEALALRKSLTEAELLAMQRQMQPHFLLNTLNSLTGLLESGEHRTALEVIDQLSLLTKRALTRDLPALVSVADELETVEAYLAIEQLRFGERLQVELTIDPRILTQKMPPFLLQPLVENAIKHSVHHNLEECTVCIRLWCEGERVGLRITDNGAGAKSLGPPGSGISLENIRTRLGLLYRSDYQLELQSPDQGGCEVNVSFPIETATV